MSVLVVPFGVLRRALPARIRQARGPLVRRGARSRSTISRGRAEHRFRCLRPGVLLPTSSGASIDQPLLRREVADADLRQGRIDLGRIHARAADATSRDRADGKKALAAVPGSMREGSYACGATKWQTILAQSCLPRARLPGIMTGHDPSRSRARRGRKSLRLMLVGAVEARAPSFRSTGRVAPYVHPERSFHALGIPHLRPLGFQSQNSQAAKADGLHDDATTDRHRRAPQPRRDLDPREAAARRSFQGTPT